MSETEFYLLALVLAIVGMFFEVKTNEIPDRLTLGGIFILLIMRGIWREYSYLHYMAGFLFIVLLVYLQIQFKKDWIGMGALKLMGACSLAIGWEYTLLSLFFLIVFILGLVLFSKIFRRTIELPVTPLFLISMGFVYKFAG